MKVLAINGSPNMDQGNTARIINPFLEGMKEAGAEVEVFYTSKLKIRPCLGDFNCWFNTPGKCLHNDDMAIGAIQAIEEYGLVPAKDIWIGSIDAVRDAFVAMKDRKLNVSVECTPLMGPSAFDALEAAWRGEELPDWIVNEDGIFPMDVVTQEVLDSRKY